MGLNLMAWSVIAHSSKGIIGFSERLLRVGLQILHKFHSCGLVQGLFTFVHYNFQYMLLEI
ncbi:hypothetical protein EJB05_42831, partial [Eragrostis curvula]